MIRLDGTRLLAHPHRLEGLFAFERDVPDCGRIADVPWPLLIGRKQTTRDTFLGTFRCDASGAGMQPR